MSAQPSRHTANHDRPLALRVEDVMTRSVVSVPPTATFHDMAELMRDRNVSALPVIDDSGALLGIVSEADLLPKENPPLTRRAWIPEREESARRRRRADGATAADIMSSPVATIDMRATLALAAQRLEQLHIKRLVVTDEDDEVVGVVSRRDVIATFTRSDAEIRCDVAEGVLPRWMMIEPGQVSVDVTDGVVELSGTVDRLTEADMLVHLVRGIDGVIAVRSDIRHRWDDRVTSPSREIPVS